MFRRLSSTDLFIKLQNFFEFRDLSIEDIRKLGKKGHDEFSDWLTINQREEMLKECLSRLM